jgi:hypothetical protein
MEGSFNDAFNIRMARGSTKQLRSRSATLRAAAPFPQDTALGFGGVVHLSGGDAGSAAALADAADALRRALAAVDAAAAATIMQTPAAVP